MKVLMRRLETEWPSWTAVFFIALLPFDRLAEIPLSVFTLAQLFLWRNAVHRQSMRRALTLVLPLFLCFWLPMVLSSFDSMAPHKSWMQSLAALRFLAAALSMSALLHAPSARWNVLRWTSYLLVFWAVDGFIQLVLGSDVFGISMHPDRLNALFLANKYQFYGPTLAMLSPLLLEYARREWPGWAWATAFVLVLGAVMISGMRSGWLSMVIVLGVYCVLMLKRENRELRRTILVVPLLAVLISVGSYLASPLFQERLELTRAFIQGTGDSMDRASSDRLPIFAAALEMYRQHPVNGVGVRAFPAAYPDYAAPDDPHMAKGSGKSGATHAHNIVLEVAADTGSIGLLGLLLGVVFAVRSWRRSAPAQRQDAFPFVLALGLILFPLNSHFALYGTYTSSLCWFLAGLWAACLRDHVTD